MQKSWIGFWRCQFSMRLLGICPPQLPAPLPIATFSLPRGTVCLSFFITVLPPILTLELLLCVPKLAAEEARLLVPAPRVILITLYLHGLGFGCCGLAESRSKGLARGTPSQVGDYCGVCISRAIPGYRTRWNLELALLYPARGRWGHQAGSWVGGALWGDNMWGKSAQLDGKESSNFPEAECWDCLKELPDSSQHTTGEQSRYSAKETQGIIKIKEDDKVLWSLVPGW